MDTSTTPYREWHCEKADVGNPYWVPNVDMTQTMMSTGLLTGGILQITDGDNTKFDVAAGEGYVIDNHTNPLAPVVQRVKWAAKEAQSTPLLTTDTRTEVLVDGDGELVLQSSVTSGDYRDYIYLGKVIHNNLTTINAVNTLPNLVYNNELDALDLAFALGSINISGNQYSANGTNLNLDKTSGESYRTGSNYVIDNKIPNNYTSSSQTALSFRYRYRNGSGGFTTGALTTSVDPTKYDTGTGTPASVPSGKYTIQRIYHYPGTGNTYLTYGQSYYNHMTDAKSAIPTEDPIIDPVLSSEAVLRSYLVLKYNASNLSDSDEAYFKSAGKLGEAMGGGAAGGDVAGPASSTDNALVRFDGTTGKLIQGSGLLADDAGVLTFNATSTPANPAASKLKMYVDTVYGLEQPNWLDQYGQTFRLCRDTLFTGLNQENNTLNVGELVYISSGNTGTTPHIKRAKADSAATMPCVGIVVNIGGIATGARGRVLKFGRTEAVLNTYGFAGGDKIYVSSSVAGAITNVAPTGQNIAQQIGWCVAASATEGCITIQPMEQKSPEANYSSVTVQNDSYTVQASDFLIVADKSGSMNINLPAATGSGRQLVIKSINLGPVTVEGNTTDTIDGELNQPLSQWDGMTVVDYASGKWVII